jgi:hypothetical protein
MKNNLALKSTLIALFAFLIVAPQIGCKKETDSTAIITVLNAATGAPIVGATVKLDCNSCQNPGNLQTDTQVTDGSGKTNHVFRYPAVLDVTITFQSNSVTGMIKLEEGETVNKTFYM